MLFPIENVPSETWDFGSTFARIVSQAFARTGLTSIHLPASLEIMKRLAF
jgi:hypothetical protein